MRNPFFVMAFTCIVFSGVYCFLHPGPEALDMLKEITIGILIGKYALAHGNGSPVKQPKNEKEIDI